MEKEINGNDTDNYVWKKYGVLSCGLFYLLPVVFY